LDTHYLPLCPERTQEEGAGSLFSAVPPFVLKEIPFGVSKFFVFTLTTRFLFQTFPAAQEDIQLSLAVSLVSGMMGGLAAAIVSNPADATISEMKKAKTKVSALDAAKNLIARGGYANLMRGLPVRMFFYPLIVSMQFFVYDVVRLYLGVGSDDLKVYLDVLGSALQDGGTTVGPV
jgi:solute carrier family 25 (mitochondrial phosphate transporter), member 3